MPRLTMAGLTVALIDILGLIAEGLVNWGVPQGSEPVWAEMIFIVSGSLGSAESSVLDVNLMIQEDLGKVGGWNGSVGKGTEGSAE